MRISVIIPCHNAERSIAQTLRFVAAQTYPACEMIVIDDASTVGPVEVIRQRREAIMRPYTQKASIAMTNCDNSRG
jgi:glycosyltransferase involved in cell wall biosynthesis